MSDRPLVITEENKETVAFAYAAVVIEGLDLESLIELATDLLAQDLVRNLSAAELAAEIEEWESADLVIEELSHTRK